MGKWQSVVLILLLLEYPLSRAKKPISFPTLTRRLNPSFTGIPSRPPVNVHVPFDATVVVILLLMEYPLGLPPRFPKQFPPSSLKWNTRSGGCQSTLLSHGTASLNPYFAGMPTWAYHSCYGRISYLGS